MSLVCIRFKCFMAGRDVKGKLKANSCPSCKHGRYYEDFLFFSKLLCGRYMPTRYGFGNQR